MQSLDDFITEHEDQIELDPSINWGNVWINIMLKPSPTLRFILQTDKKRHLWAIILVAGFISSIAQFVDPKFNLEGFSSTYLFGYVLGITTAFIIIYFIFAWFLKLIGQLVFRFMGKTFDLLVVQVWSVVPSVFALLIEVIINVLLNDGHAGGFGGNNDLTFLSMVLIGFIRFVGYIWSIVIAIAGIKVVQNTTTAKAIGNYIIVALVIMLLAFGLAMGYYYYITQMTLEANGSMYNEMIN